MEINAGKLGISLNLKQERGKQLLRQLIKDADMVIEGFSPGTMERMGLGYEQLRKINPFIIYVQQSGMGQVGTYGPVRSFGPTAQALSGLSEMSGYAEPYPPAGIGYSYLDWFGAYNMATAMMAALYRRQITGKGCYIDSSQVETGIYLTGTTVLEHSANGTTWSRYGNRSPYKLAAPHGAFRVAGHDRWLAISCFTGRQWEDLLSVLGEPKWGQDERFSTLEGRVALQDELEPLVESCTVSWEPYKLMAALQEAGVPAGVCQTAQDRCEIDPQLRHLEWLVELEQTELGRWPVKESAIRYSETPPYAGGINDRSGPNYGEHNAFVYGEILGLSKEEIRELEDDGVI
jgi:crotonobetainyl-CoA:carnitine CoA-transferase CaiB-like acyl-CoA transferase